MAFFSSIFGGRAKTESEFVSKVRENFSLSVIVLAKMLVEMMETREMGERFVLEELDAARHSDSSFIQEFLRNSGYRSAEYAGKMNKSEWGNSDTLEYLQSQFRSFTFQIRDPILRAKFSIAVVDAVMQHWKLGKYSRRRAS
jgi:hypothetical protein